MSRTQTPKNKLPSRAPHASVDASISDDVTYAQLTGLVDEKFPGFGDVGMVKAVVLDVSGMTRMTSFGVRQWIKALDALPKSAECYLLGCPTFFVDQLNMVLNFGGACKVLTVMAPFTCTSCSTESSELVDVHAERASLIQGTVADRTCARCEQRLELDETPESFFAFVAKYAATSVHPAAAQLMAERGLYLTAKTDDVAVEKPTKIIKLVHGSVTYFRVSGTIGSLFRSRPFLIGAEGEVVIDLAEVDRFDSSGHKEWKRLLKTLSAHVPSVTLVDVGQSFLEIAGDTLVVARNVIIASLLVPRRCQECDRVSHDSASLERVTWPFSFRPGVCGMCGGETISQLANETLAPLQKACTIAPPASNKVIGQRVELLSRALTDANVAQAGENAAAAVSADDTILGKYKIVQRLSVGGMAEVFLATQVGLGGFEKPVALKRIQRKLLDSRHLAIDMFLNEAKIAGRLAHPNIVPILDVGEVGGSLYLAMEYVHGKDLRAVTKKLHQNGSATLPLGEALYIVREVAQALHYAYWANDITGKQLAVVHRDVSPHNIILGYDGSVKLIDFGVAMSSVTEHGEESLVVGKWHYMSPEATSAGKKVDHRSDLFSLGVILYLLLSGQMPFTDRDPKKIVKKIHAGHYKPLDEIAVVPENLTALVHSLLSPDPKDRPQRGQDVVARLTEISRMSGVDSSGQKVADLLADLFPEEASMSVEEAPLQIQFGDVGSSGSKASFTPPSLSRFDNPVDVSVTLHRRTSRSISAVSGNTPTPSPSIGSGPRSASQLSEIPRARVKMPELKNGGIGAGKIVLVIVIAALLALVAYFVLPSY